MTACLTSSPKKASASVLILRKISAEISWGVYFLPSTLTVSSVPIFLLICMTVFSGFSTACLFAGSPTRT